MNLWRKERKRINRQSYLFPGGWVDEESNTCFFFVGLAVFAHISYADFLRPSVAFYSSEESGIFEEYDVNEPFYQTMAVSNVSDGEYRTGEGLVGEDIAVHGKNAEYVFGIGKNSGRLLRSQDGLSSWEHTNWEVYLNGGRVWALQTGTILIADRAEGEVFQSTLYRSSDNGDTVETVLTTGGEGFSSDKAYLRSWSVYEGPNGAVLAVEYGRPGIVYAGRRIFRSDDDGQTFSKVWDSQEEGETYNHHHDVCYHSGLGRWIVVAGDGRKYRRFLANDNDGRAGFWYNLTEPGFTYLQPTALLDYGHPTRLLFGSDTRSHVGWVDVSDSNAGEFGNLITNWDPRRGHGLCFLLFEHDGIYYACEYADAVNKQNNAVISVSTDLKNWAIYHRFTNNERGVDDFAGYAGGKLHLNVLDVNESESHFVISPAQVSTQRTGLVEPGTNNMFDDPNTSSVEDNLDEWWLGSCAWTTSEITTDEQKHGNASLRLVGSVSASCTGHIYSPSVSVEAGKSYQGRFWIKSKNGTNTTLGARYVMNTDAGEPILALIDAKWQEIILEPYRVGPNDGNNLRLFISIGECDDIHPSEQIEVYIDSLQIEEVVGGNWQLGGTSRADTRVHSVKTLPEEWTNVFTFYPSGRKEHYDGLDLGSKLHIKSWRVGDAYAELYYDANSSEPGGDDEFVLFVTEDTNSYFVRTEAQYFQRYAQIKFAIVCYRDDSDSNKTKLKMHVSNGGAAETPGFVTTGSFDAFGAGSISTYVGDKDGLKVFGGLYSHDDFLAEAVADEDIEALLDIAGTGFLAADLNGDLCINFQDLSILALHWRDANCVFPELCGETDINWSGEVDYFDLAIFAKHWLKD